MSLIILAMLLHLLSNCKKQILQKHKLIPFLIEQRKTYMKTMLIALVTTLSLTTFANSGSGKGTNLFPGYGAVSSSLVCVTDDAVRFTLPARSVKTCVKYNSPLLGHNCIKYKTTTKAAMVFEAPLSFEVLGCLETKTVYNAAQVASEVCTKMGMVTYHQPRTYYVVKTVKVNDHAETVREEHTIPTCN